MKGLILIVTAGCAAGFTAVAVAVAAPPQRDFSVRPVSGSKVTGTGVVRSLGAETGMTLTLRGLPRNKKFRVILNSGSCARRSASFALLGIASAGADGKANYSSLVRKQGAPMRFQSIADGQHVIAVVVGAKTLACGSIPA